MSTKITRKIISLNPDKSYIHGLFNSLGEQRDRIITVSSNRESYIEEDPPENVVSGPPSNLIDGSQETCWVTGPSDKNNVTITIDLGPLNQLEIVGYSLQRTSSTQIFPFHWTLFAKLGDDWFFVDTQSRNIPKSGNEIKYYEVQKQISSRIFTNS